MAHSEKTSTLPRVLVVDDEEILRSIVTFMLADKGYDVAESSSGHEAWDALAHSDVDLVVSDIRMPDGDGLELLDRITHKDRPRPSVILITGYSDISEDEALARGAAAIFGKPFDYGVFLQTVDHVLHGVH